MFNAAKITLFFDLGSFSYKNNPQKGAFSYKRAISLLQPQKVDKMGYNLMKPNIRLTFARTIK